MKFNNITKIKELISRSDKILITTHTNPDGDAIGSSLALFHFLKKLDKEVYLLVPNLYPEFISWLPGNENIIVYERDRKQSKQALENVETVFCLDYNAIHRSGILQDVLRNAEASMIMIDHHPDPATEEFKYVVSTTETSSTSELLYEFFLQIDPAFIPDRDIATCLFVGIMTDTGSFSFACNRPETFSITAKLLETGIDAEWIHRMVYDTFSEDRLRLLGYSLGEKLVVLKDYATAYIALSRKDLDTFHYQVGDTEGIVNYALSIEGITMAILLTERKGRIRLSFRSKGDFSVNEVARDHFKGGGHKNAAGGDSYENLEQTIKKLEGLLPAYKQRLLSKTGQ
ncbi:MAG: bifunctional oligoribonuclease/PAP phosphatase NrnA [Bacteroidota bacterium]